MSGEWAMLLCPERELEMGETHEPAIWSAKLLPVVSTLQTELEFEVSCKYCGQMGIATVQLTYEHVMSVRGQ